MDSGPGGTIAPTEAVDRELREAGAEAQLLTVPLADHHRCHDFLCAKSARVQDFMRQHSRRWHNTHYCGVYVWPDDADPGRILGFYTLSSAVIVRSGITKSQQKKLPGETIPVMLIGFMGRHDEPEHNELVGKGEWLIMDAARRVAKAREIMHGIWGLSLDAENAKLADWYAGVADFKVLEGVEPGRSGEVRMYVPLSLLLSKQKPSARPSVKPIAG